MKKVFGLSLVFMSALVSQVALAGFDDAEARAKAYRDSGQLEQAEKAEASAQARAAIPRENKHFVNLVTRFAQRLGGISIKHITYDNDGSINSIDFTTREMSCRVRGADMRCVDLHSMIEYDFLPLAPEGWSYGVQVR